jgi:hypothetical protein
MSFLLRDFIIKKFQVTSTGWNSSGLVARFGGTSNVIFIRGGPFLIIGIIGCT